MHGSAPGRGARLRAGRIARRAGVGPGAAHQHGRGHQGDRHVCPVAVHRTDAFRPGSHRSGACREPRGACTHLRPRPDAATAPAAEATPPPALAGTTPEPPADAARPSASGRHRPDPATATGIPAPTGSPDPNRRRAADATSDRGARPTRTRPNRSRPTQPSRRAPRHCPRSNRAVRHGIAGCCGPPASASRSRPAPRSRTRRPTAARRADAASLRRHARRPPNGPSSAPGRPGPPRPPGRPARPAAPARPPPGRPPARPGPAPARPPPPAGPAAPQSPSGRARSAALGPGRRRGRRSTSARPTASGWSGRGRRAPRTRAWPTSPADSTTCPPRSSCCSTA